MHRALSTVKSTTSPASAMLLAALVAALLATAAGLMLIETQSARAASGETLRFARASLADQRLLAVALVRLDSDEPLPSQGVIYEDANGRVLRQDAAGLVDVNAAQPDRLAALFAALGADSDEAAQLGDSIADWRDGDDLRRLHGAEADDYARAGAPPPGNRPFITETELAAVLGMSPPLLACALPFLTTYSGASDVDGAAAPPRLRSLLGLEGASVTGATPLGRVIILSAEAPIAAHALMRQTLWVRLTGDPHHPIMIHRAAQDLAPADSAEQSPICAAESRA